MNNLVQTFLPIYVFDSRETIQPIRTIYYENFDDCYITYYILFPINGEISACPNVYSSMHPLDNESITIKYDKNNSKLICAYYFAHGSQGRLYTRDELVMRKERPIVYVALNSHASYPKHHTYVRCLGLASDKNDGNGEMWYPYNPLHISQMPEPYKNRSLSDKWYRRIPENNYPWYKRWFCIFW